MRTHRIPLLVAAAWLAIALCLPGAAGAGALDEAWEQFYDADFELALETTDALLAGGAPTGNDAVNLHVVRARCFARLGQEDDAMDSFCRTVAAGPDWSPDPTFSADELALFRRALATCPVASSPSSYASGPAPILPLPGDEPTDDSESGGSWITSKTLWITAGAAVLALGLASRGTKQVDVSGDGVDARRAPTFQWGW